MKHLRKFFESVEEENEIREVCIWIQDLVDTIEITDNGGYYNINIRCSRKSNPSIDELVKNSERLQEITKEYTDLLLRLEDLGYKVSYHLLENKHHLSFFNMTGKIQINKKDQ
jgi:hypothetical protein